MYKVNKQAQTLRREDKEALRKEKDKKKSCVVKNASVQG